MIEIINHIKSASGTNAKLDLLRSYLKTEPDFKRVLFYTYNPFYNYYVKKIPTFFKSSTISTMDGMFLLLDDLRCRKLTGNNAIEMISSFLGRSNDNLAELTKLILGRDLKMGINTTSINKVSPNLIPTFDIMLAESKVPLQPLFSKHPYLYVQKKSDGKRCIMVYCDGEIKYYARSGKEMELLANHTILNNGLDSLRTKLGYDYVLDGELIIVNEDGSDADRKYSNGLLNRKNLSTKEIEQFSFIVWDVFPYSEFVDGNFSLNYDDRIDILIKYIKKQYFNLDMIETHVATAVEEVDKITCDYITRGFEGSIVKTPDHKYIKKRSKDWIKFKNILECDLKVVAYKYGKPGTKYESCLGSLSCESSDGYLSVDVGSGFTDDDRLSITESIIGSIITVQYNQIISNNLGGYSLYLPRYIETRTDKTDADTLDKIKKNG